jgi:hypothetical protein
MSIFKSIFGTLWGLIKGLFESTQDAFNRLPKEQQDAILQGVQVSQIIKDSVGKAESDVIQLAADKLGISHDIATGLFAQLSADLKVDQVVAGVADKIEAGLTDLAHNALFENIAKFATSFLGAGQVSWITLALGVVEYAYQYLKGKGELPVATSTGDPVPPDPTHPKP